MIEMDTNSTDSISLTLWFRIHTDFYVSDPVHTVILSDRTKKNGPSPVLPSSLSRDS